MVSLILCFFERISSIVSSNFSGLGNLVVMDKNDSESGKSHPGEEEKRIETQAQHENGLQALPDPDAALSAEERAQIVSIGNRTYTRFC